MSCQFKHLPLSGIFTVLKERDNRRLDRLQPQGEVNQKAQAFINRQGVKHKKWPPGNGRPFLICQGL
jgi:hypothetical protein